ncbi:hypothetical protein NQZ68_042183 [Dissostichus eleginoides]|nr:hypothetical protein NQZ68_042183 [Dissostichus eleginoides]
MGNSPASNELRTFSDSSSNTIDERESEFTVDPKPLVGLSPRTESSKSKCGLVCELDIIFNFEKAYFILDEFLLGGEAQETSKKNVLKAIEQADLLQENIDFQMRLFAAPS